MAKELGFLARNTEAANFILAPQRSPMARSRDRNSQMLKIG
jgi:hypothetical protein